MPVEERSPLSVNLQRLIKEKGFDNRSLAKKANVDEDTIGRIIKIGSAHNSTLVRIAKVLNVSVEQLFYSDVKSEHGARGNEVWDQTIEDALRNFDELDDGADKLTAAVEIWKLVDRAIKEQRARKAGSAGRQGGSAKAEARGAE